MGKPAQKLAHRAVTHSAAAEVGGDERRKNPVLFENVVVLGNKRIALIALCRTFRKARADDLDERLQVEKRAQATPLRVERLAKEQIKMRTTTPAMTLYVRPDGSVIPAVPPAPPAAPAATGAAGARPAAASGRTR